MNVLELLNWVYKEFENEPTFKAVGIYTNTGDKTYEKYIRIYLDDYLMRIYPKEINIFLIINPYSIKEVTKKTYVNTEIELKQKITDLIKNKVY